MEDYLPYGRQHLDEDDYQAVLSVLHGKWLTQGKTVEQFEQSLIDYCGSRYAVACSSGTAALHILMLALCVKPGDEVITTPITFASSANCVRFCGGIPVFADIEPQTASIDVAEIEQKITSKTVGIIAVHLTGNPCDMEKIQRLAQKHNLWLVEDACHALGAEYQHKRIGSCEYSRAAVFSFHPVKHITTGEGGAILTNDQNLAERMERLRTHGIIQHCDPKIRKEKPWLYQMVELGYNYRITDIQCALGISQLKKLDGFLVRRREIAAEYDKMFAGMEGIKPLGITPGGNPAYHLYVLRLDFKRFGLSRGELMNTLSQQHKIITQVHYIQVYRHPYYQELLGDIQLPQAEEYYKSCLSIPIFPAMAPGDPTRFFEALTKTLGIVSG